MPRKHIPHTPNPPYPNFPKHPSWQKLVPYTRYTLAQKQFVKQHYHALSNAELAQALGIDKASKVQALARRLCVKWRAENGAPMWREKKQPTSPNWLR